MGMLFRLDLDLNGFCIKLTEMKMMMELHRNWVSEYGATNSNSLYDRAMSDLQLSKSSQCGAQHLPSLSGIVAVSQVI